jgi:ParB/RepB/Spo0J family partition protein
MELQETALDAIDLDFERFRIIDPRAEARMLQSMKTHGQLSPLFAGRIERRPLLIDGFKRYRAARALGKSTVELRCVDRPLTTLKAIALTVNAEQSPGSEIEKALLLHSLHREDRMTQEDIALLCNRHKSWVCRRIALVDRLGEEVKTQLHLGLLTVSAARELFRLPRGNQAEVLQSIQNHHLSSRQCANLVGEFLRQQHPRQQARLLDAPFMLLDQHTPPRIDCGIFTPTVMNLVRGSGRLGRMASENGIGSLTAEQRCYLQRTLEQVRMHCATVIAMTAAGLCGIESQSCP